MVSSIGFAVHKTVPPIKFVDRNVKSIVFVIMYHLGMHRCVEHDLLRDTSHIDLQDEASLTCEMHIRNSGVKLKLKGIKHCHWQPEQTPGICQLVKIKCRLQLALSTNDN